METTDSTRLPPHVASVCRSFLMLAERVAWCCRDDGERPRRRASSPASAQLQRWLNEICRPSAFEIDALVRDVHCDATTDDVDDEGQLDILDDLALLRLVLSDDTFASVRWAKVRLAEALERARKHSALTEAATHAWAAVALILPHMQALPSDDRAASYVLASTIAATAHDKAVLLEHFPLDVSLYPLASRSDMLLAACSARHARMVAQLLDVSTSVPISGDVVMRGLQHACACGASAVVDALLDRYASTPGAWEHHSALLRAAVESTNFDVVRLLLECDPRGAFTRIDELADELKREATASVDSTPWLDAIIGKRSFAAWDARALEAAIQANDCARFDLLVHHIEWHRDDLATALATAHAMERAGMAEALARLLERDMENAQSRPLRVFAVGDEVEARKRGRTAFSHAVIHGCYLNGTYDVAFSRSSDECSDAPALPRIEAALESDRIRHRSAGRAQLNETSGDAKEDEGDAVRCRGNAIASGDTTATPDGHGRALARDLYDPAPSSLSEDDDEDDDDDREIRADAAIMGDRALELVSGLDNLLADSDEDAASASDAPSLSSSSAPSTGSIDKLLELQLTQLQSLPIADEHLRLAGDAVGDVVSLTGGAASDARVPRAESHDDVNETSSRLDTNDIESAERGGSMATRIVVEQALSADAKALDEERACGTGRTDASASEYACGDVVDANFLAMGKFHRGRIVQVHTDGDYTCYDVAYAEFDETEARVPASRLRLRTDASTAPSSAARVDIARSARVSTAKPARAPSRSSSRAATSSSAAGALQSAALVVPLLPTATATPAAAKRAPLKSARPLTTASSAYAPPLSLPAKPPATARRATTQRRASARAAANAISWRELEEWRNVDAILTRKRRVVNALNGGIESARVPWGEEFAAIQSLKRFAAQHPDVLREHIASQLEEVGAASGSQSVRHSQPALSPAAASQAREALLLVKDLSFLLQQRLAPFLDVILPAVLPAVFSANKRFLCDTAYEVLEALVVHCSGRKLVLLLLQYGDECARRDDIRLLNLTSVYVEKCLGTLNATEIDAVFARPSAASIIASLAHLLVCKAAPSKIAAQKSLGHIHAALQDAAYERVVRASVSDELASTVLRHTLYSSGSGESSGARSPTRSPVKGSGGGAANPVVVVHQGMSILQRMVVQRQNRVVPAPE